MEQNKNIFDQFKPSKKPGIPQGYFEQLQKQLNAQVAHKTDEKNSGLKLAFYSIASIAAVLLLFFTFTKQNVLDSSEVADIKDLNTNELGGYIEENIENFDDELFLEVGYLALTTNPPQESFNEKIEDLDSDVISNYLSEDDEFNLEDF